MLIGKVLNLLRDLGEATPEACDDSTEDDLRPLRDRIDAIDLAVLCLLNERSRCANEIGKIKKIIGIPVYVPSREEQVMENVVRGNTGPLPDEATRRLFERIIDETRSLERHLYQDGDKGGD